MGTSYAGFNPKVFAAQPGGYGRFISGLMADDDDLDDSAHLMALAMAAMDNIQFIAWRTLDLVSGGTYTYTATINWKNAVWFTSVTGAGTAAGSAWFFKGTSYITSGAVMHVGHALGAGSIEVERGSNITLDGVTAGSGEATIVATGTNANIYIRNNATLQVEVDGAAVLDGLVYLGTNTNRAVTQTLQRHPFKKIGDHAHTVLRRTSVTFSGSSSSTVTVSNPEQYDIIRVSRCSCTDGSTTISCHLNLDAPAGDTPDGVTLRVYVGQGAYLEQPGNTLATLDVVAHGVTYRKTVPIAAGGSNTGEAVGMTFEVLAGEWVSMG